MAVDLFGHLSDLNRPREIPMTDTPKDNGQACTWPEQDLVYTWLAGLKIALVHEKVAPLLRKLTDPRIERDKRISDLMAIIDERDAEITVLQGCLKALSQFNRPENVGEKDIEEKEK